MDDITVRGLVGVSIGIILFLMGYSKGSKSGVSAAVEHMFKLGLLATDTNGNIVAGPKLKHK
jgi:hypothetical protein|tara:strand:+ start:8 stop:193 length:186 start_codon:yes stop_codon:yes gene_type:complete